MPCFLVRYTNARTRRAGGGDIHGDEYSGLNYESGHMLFGSAMDAYLYGRNLHVKADIEISACLVPACPARTAEEQYGLTPEFTWSEHQRQSR